MTVKERDRVEAVWECLNEALNHAGYILGDLDEIDGDDDVTEIYAECEDLMEHISKKMEDIDTLLAADDREEMERMRQESYHW